MYGPLSLLFLLGTWASLLALGFALLHWGVGSQVLAPPGLHGFAADLLLSGATLSTLSLEGLSPATILERVFGAVEALMGLSFFALVIGYLPTLSQAFSQREVNVTLLDARAGSPPSASELLARHMDFEQQQALAQLLQQWDRWSAELLETHVSFPVLAYYRSQHDNQSWVAALTTILDVCALIIAGLEREPVPSARLAFAMARHAAVDLTRTFGLPPRPPATDRLSSGELEHLRSALRAAGLSLREGQGQEIEETLRRLRQTYEPYMNALGEFLLMPLPPWVSREGKRDNWETTR